MRRPVVPALIALLAAVLAARRRRAAQADRRVVAEAPTAPAPPVAPQPLETPAAPEPAAPEPAPKQPAATAPSTGPRFVSIPWTLASDDETSVEGGAASHRQELEIQFALLGERMELDRIDVRETESQVFVTVLARYEPAAPGRRPPAYGVAREATITLARPLGDRALVHAPDQLAELTGDEPG